VVGITAHVEDPKVIAAATETPRGQRSHAVGAHVIGALSMLAAFSGLYFVWVPDHASWLAALVGIGRGVDLMLYLWVVISLIVLLNLHLKLRAQMEVITVLARELAIANARSAASPK
jgi:hypothetical protein